MRWAVSSTPARGAVSVSPTSCPGQPASVRDAVLDQVVFSLDACKLQQLTSSRDARTAHIAALAVYAEFGARAGLSKGPSSSDEAQVQAASGLSA